MVGVDEQNQMHYREKKETIWWKEKPRKYTVSNRRAPGSYSGVEKSRKVEWVSPAVHRLLV